MRTRIQMGLGILMVLAVVNVSASDQAVAVSPKVAVLQTVAWSQGDETREGAAEMIVLLEIARVKQDGARGGLIAIGDRRGLFSARAEEALQQAVLQGVPVVKLASNGRVLPAPHGLFLDGGALSAEEAKQVLSNCLKRFGALPSVLKLPSGEPFTQELRAHLELFQREFTLSAATRFVTR